MRGDHHGLCGSPRGEDFGVEGCAILVEGKLYDLFSELLLVRWETQSIVDTLRGLGKLPSLNQAHQLFYRVLRGKGFRAHQAKQAYKYALAIVKSARENRGRKPVPRKLSARLDMYDAGMDFDAWTVMVKLRDKVFKAKTTPP